MKFIRDLLGKKRSTPQADEMTSPDQLEQSYRRTIGSMTEEAGLQAEAPRVAPSRPKAATRTRMIDTSERPAADTGAVNIWDLEDDGGAGELPAGPVTRAEPAPERPAPAVAAQAATRSPARSRRTKTRLIGFEKSDGDVVDLFNDQTDAAPAKPAGRVRFPVGWIVVADGPGRGESFSLQTGMSQIGRGEDQAVQLDFGDNSISRSNHAAIVFDPDTKEFLLGHGGKSNIVRLNDKPVISNESLKTGDTIRIGDTVLRFVALCDKSFNWSDSGTEEDEDVAIA
ncbi:MAG: FHA domain-containing protein [Yoonia sp.]|uniref:FHA domain-containing protein n=1 Tax=Yoonia sp. TaxID=2212373 RepID=UPI003EF90FF7